MTVVLDAVALVTAVVSVVQWCSGDNGGGNENLFVGGFFRVEEGVYWWCGVGWLSPREKDANNIFSSDVCARMQVYF